MPSACTRCNNCWPRSKAVTMWTPGWYAATSTPPWRCPRRSSWPVSSARPRPPPQPLRRCRTPMAAYPTPMGPGSIAVSIPSGCRLQGRPRQRRLFQHPQCHRPHLVALRPCRRVGRPRLRLAVQAGAEGATVVSVARSCSMCRHDRWQEGSQFRRAHGRCAFPSTITTVPIDESFQPDLA